MKKKAPRRAPAWDAKRVRALRESFGESQEAFAHRLGISVVTVSRWERGHTISRLGIATLDRLDGEGR